MKFTFIAILFVGVAFSSELGLFDLDNELAGAQALMGLSSMAPSDIDKISSLIDSLQQKLEAEIKKLTEEDALNKKRRDDAKAAWEALKQSLAVAKAELAKLEEDLADIKYQLAKYSSELSIAKENYASVKADNDAERKTLAEEKTFIEDIQTLVTEVKNTGPGEERETMLVQLGEKLDKLSSTELLGVSTGRNFEELGLIGELLTQMLGNIADRLAAMAAQEKELLAGIAKLKKVVADLQKEKTSLEEAIVLAKVKIESIEKKVSAAEGKYLELAALYEQSHKEFLENMAVIAKEKAIIVKILSRVATYKQEKQKTGEPTPAPTPKKSVGIKSVGVSPTAAPAPALVVGIKSQDEESTPSEMDAILS
eukprot:JP446294.1.p1 GENE.JP446294.1~~JP446294.1.p1  ORF type:complete len:380 (+),score=143.21 JP446294.1:38-1141(+)